MRFLRYYLPWRVVKGPMSRRSEIICSLGVGNAVRAACRGAGPLASNPTDRSSQMTGMRPLVHHGGGCYETNGLSVRRLFCAMTATCRFAQIGKRHPVCRRRRCLFGRWLGRRRFDRHRFFSRRFLLLRDKTGGLTIQIDARCASDQSQPIKPVMRVATKGLTQFLLLDGVTNLGQNVGVNSDLEWASPLLEQDKAGRKSHTKQFQ